MRVLFCTSNLPGAVIIRGVTWSDWSHVALLLDDDSVVEATWPAVQRVPLEEILAKHTHHAIVEFPGDNQVVNAALSQIGKPYDLTALFGILSHRDWQEQDKWFCSELIAWAFDKGGFPLFRKEAMHRVTPQHLWMLASGKDVV